MSYAAALGATALGYDLVIDTPFGKQTVSLPLEKMTQDLSKQAVEAAWPSIQTKLNAEMPKLLATAEDQAMKVLLPKMLPQIEKEAVKIVNSTMQQLAPAAVAAVGAVVLSTWLAAYWVRKKR